MSKKIILAVSLSIIIALSVNYVHAQSVSKLTAIPPRLELDSLPGEAVAKQLKVKNEGDTQLALEVKVHDFIVADKEGTPIPVTEEISGRWSSASWISVTPTKFTLNPGETKQLDFVAVIPENASPGGHYAVVFYSPVRGGVVGEPQEVKPGIVPTVGTLVYFNIPGDITEHARVVLMDIPNLSEYGPVKITTEIENLSDIHINPTGTIKIYNMFGKLNTTLALENQNIFPGTTRIFSNKWPQKFGFGKYEAQLNAVYGSQDNNLFASVFFWILPWRIITIAILVVALAALLIVYFKKPKEVKDPVDIKAKDKK